MAIDFLCHTALLWLNIRVQLATHKMPTQALSVRVTYSAMLADKWFSIQMYTVYVALAI